MESSPTTFKIKGGKLVVWETHNGKIHRIDGPAAEYANGDKEWYLNDRFMEFSEWKQEVRQYYDSQEDYLLMLLKLD